MYTKWFICIQYLTPQHLLTKLAGFLADSRTVWLKRILINQFIKHYHVNMSEALIENPEAYGTFNEFFTRKLKPALRPIAQAPVVSPVDGCISQIGTARKETLIQAKGFDFTLTHLLGGDASLADIFSDGAYATLYLAPRDYHRIHMPIDGTLIKTIYVPGKLFSVNRATSEHIQNLYARNERLICIFDTSVGKMAIILVGAMIVGSIETVWDKHTAHPTLRQGDELGYFKLGSTVIMLFEKNKVQWHTELGTDTPIVMGQGLATIAH